MRLISHDEYGFYPERIVPSERTRDILNDVSRAAARFADELSPHGDPTSGAFSQSGTLQGLPARAPDAALDFVLHARPRPTPNVITCAQGWLVNSTIRKVIEAHDRGVHGFWPTELHWMSGQRVYPDYWLLNIADRRETVVLEHSELRLFTDETGRVIRKVPDLQSLEAPAPYAGINTSTQAKLQVAVSCQAMDGINLWSETYLDLPSGNTCVSEALFADLMQANMYSLLPVARLQEI